MGVWWGVAALLWAGFAFMATATRHGVDDADFFAGNFVGRLLMTLLPALLFRFVYVKVERGDKRVWHPWVLGIAAILTFFMYMAAATAEGEG